MKLLSYLRWGSAELLFTISILCSVFFGAYALPVQLANDISTTQLSILSGIFFVVFAISQLYSGYLINRVSTKVLIGFSAILASFGVFLFANTHVFSLLIIARIIIGLGLGCTFVGVLYIVEQEFKTQFALFASLSQSISNIAAGIVAIFGSSLINKYSYQSTYNLIGALLLVTSLFVFIFLPGKAKIVNNHEQESFIQNVTKITTNSRFLAATVYFGGIFSVILTYVDLFNVKYREVVFHMSPTKAVILNGTIPLGVALGSIIAGTLSL
ncbi:MFS transporter [Francisella adeliensis]|uniref:MFS transporter n=1 Tax=Francisella adeliensis TaxID=2007306 RepID=A0A2Z4XYA4_9GAMM|nr:MFS transporter [Francisella adeliensis]AXA33769.1 hypothetical protein CDH04_04780 [Francisella adeliensis]MBK2085667.1 MFS transporter [Francisella adeliensis]MBK2097545.1 MFS transporter [Francisella adeliensis]QIW12003.1 MFS transporter [Francisella adeliensis]QIW13878.1 MFS transporter [Francisella adeliensis]